MKKMIFLPVLAIGIVLIGGACDKTETTTNSSSNTNTEASTNTSVSTNTATNTATNTSTNTSGTVSTGTNGITISEPGTNATVDGTFSVKGTASGDSVTVRVKNSAGTVMTTVTATVRNNAYVVNALKIQTSRDQDGTIEVFQKNSAGSEVNLVSRDIKFKGSSSGATVVEVNSTTNTGGVNVDVNVNTSESGDFETGY